MRSGTIPVARTVFPFLFGWLALAAAAQAQYPSRMVRAIVPYTPGSSADLIARNLGPRLSEGWRVPFLVDSRAGASGIIGVQAVVAAPGDGYTVLIMADNFASVGVALPLAEGGRIRILAAGAAKRAARTPEIPSFIESGVKDFNVGTWFAMLVPKGTPRGIRAKLHADIAALLKEPAVAELMSKQGMTPAGGTPEELHDLIRSDFDRWNRIVREANIKAD